MLFVSDAHSPIGVFDSGLGGLSVLKHIKASLPFEQVIYVADSANAPYGGKSQEFVQGRSHEISAFLSDQGVKLIVVACNTATAVAVSYLRETIKTPIVAMEPAIKPAVTLTETGKIGVLATAGTLESHRFAELHDRYGANVEVFTQACSGWAEMVEKGQFQRQDALRMVERYVNPLLEEGVDTLILGCTHYPFLRSLIEQVVEPNIRIIDTGSAVARRVDQVLGQLEMKAQSQSSAPDVFYSSGSCPDLALKINNLLGYTPEVCQALPEKSLSAGRLV